MKSYASNYSFHEQYQPESESYTLFPSPQPDTEYPAGN